MLRFLATFLAVALVSVTLLITTSMGIAALPSFWLQVPAIIIDAIVIGGTMFGAFWFAGEHGWLF